MSVTFQNEALAKHRELADAIKKTLKVEGPQIVETESHQAYNSNLPEGITPETVKEISKYNQQYLKASTLAVGEVAADAFQKDRELKELSATVGFNAPNDNYHFSIERQREFPIPRRSDEPADAPRRTKVKHLHIERTVDLGSTSIKSVTSVMSEEFEGMFNK